MSTLRGKLQSISLVDVLQLLHANRKTGELLVTRAKQNGVLYVLNGEVVHAETAQALGETAAFDILEWDQGSFEFVTTPVKVPTTIKRSVPDLLMEAARTTRFPQAPVGHLPGPEPGALADPEGAPAHQGPADLRRGPARARLPGRLPHLLRDHRRFGTGRRERAAGVRHLQAAGRLTLLKPTVAVTTTVAKGGFFQKAEQVKVAKIHEAHWLAMGPYGANPIGHLRIVWPRGSVLAQVQFVKGMSDQTIGISRELMQSWELPEGIFVSIRPAL